jgi:hypothetical protein
LNAKQNSNNKHKRLKGERKKRGSKNKTPRDERLIDSG